MEELAFDNFQDASQAVLAHLHGRLGFRLWMVTRTSGDDWIVLQARDEGYGLHAGARLRWSDSFCRRMVEGLGPRVAPDSQKVAAYADAPIARELAIGAYVGVPLLQQDGTLFGTLCAIDPSPQPASLVDELPLIELMATLLSTILRLELSRAEAARRIERLVQDSELDTLTGVYNRRGWNRLVAREEERCRRYGHPAFVLLVDLNGLKETNDTEGHAAGDELIARASRALREAVREIDIVARLGGDEFGVVAVQCDPAGAQSLLARVRARLAFHQVDAAVGMAPRVAPAGLEAAVEQADRRMYEDKQRSRATT